MQGIRGFSLIELMTTVAILSILVALCFPLYSQYLVHTKRLEAASILSQLAVAMEEYRAEHQTYETATLAALHFSERVAKDSYQLAIKSVDRDAYVLAAIPIGKQYASDANCAELNLNSSGERSISGPGKIEECW